MPEETCFQPCLSVEQVERGLELAQRFDALGLLPCVTTDAANGGAPNPTLL